MNKLTSATLAAVLVSPPGLALADAGHGAALGKPGDPAKGSCTIEIASGDDMRYRPSRIRVERGETVRFVVKNAGKINHELVLGSMKELKEHAALMRKHPGMEHEEPNQAA